MFKKALIIILLILAFSVRLYKFSSPIADWHSFRQADTASVTRNFVNNGINLLDPHYHDLSDIQSGKVNPQGYRLVELPIYNSLSAAAFYLTGKMNLSIEETQRLISIVCSLLSGLIIFAITKKLTKSFSASIFAMSFFLFLPFNIFYSRTILPEPMAVLFMVLALYFIIQQQFIIAGLPLALGLLLNPYTALLLFPVILYYFFHKSYFKLHKSFFKIIFFGIISLTPFIAWRLWIGQHPEGIPASDWLFNGGNIRFRPAWFRWLFDERIAKLILGSFGLIPLFLGFAYKKESYQKVAIALSLGVIFYFSVIARGNVQHDYYQVLIIPFLAIISGVGCHYIANFIFDSKLLAITAVIILSAFTFGFSGYQVIEYYKVNNPVIMTAGKYVDQTLPKDAIIIAPYTGDTAFLYQTARSGWPTEVYDVSKVKSLVAPRPLYLVSVNFDTYTNMMIKKYPIIFKNDLFVILNLN